MEREGPEASVAATADMDESEFHGLPENSGAGTWGKSFLLIKQIAFCHE